MKIIFFFDRLLKKVVLYPLIFSLFTMLFLTIFNILSRYFQHPYLWIDPLVRHLVFLTAFLGGVIAIERKQHIAIDITSKILENFGHHKATFILESIIKVAAIATLTALIYGSIAFVKDSFAFETNPEFLGIQRGFLVMIIPLGATLLLLQFFLKLFTSPKLSNGSLKP